MAARGRPSSQQRISPVARTTVATPGALAALTKGATAPQELLLRFAARDWGITKAEGAAANDAAGRGWNGRSMADRVLAVHRVDGCDVWIITEADLSVTTILLPEEY